MGSRLTATKTILYSTKREWISFSLFSFFQKKRILYCIVLKWHVCPCIGPNVAINTTFKVADDIGRIFFWFRLYYVCIVRYCNKSMIHTKCRKKICWQVIQELPVEWPVERSVTSHLYTKLHTKLSTTNPFISTNQIVHSLPDMTSIVTMIVISSNNDDAIVLSPPLPNAIRSSIMMSLPLQAERRFHSTTTTRICHSWVRSQRESKCQSAYHSDQ